MNGDTCVKKTGTVARYAMEIAGEKSLFVVLISQYTRELCHKNELSFPVSLLHSGRGVLVKILCTLNNLHSSAITPDTNACLRSDRNRAGAPIKVNTSFEKGSCNCDGFLIGVITTKIG